ETHYGEVARQILARQDPLDLWWRPGYGPDGNYENTFWSKPALPFWLMALCMKVFGVGAGAADEMVRSPWPELAIRLPSMLAALTSAVFLGYVVWRLCARPSARARAPVNVRARAAGILTAVVLSTSPQWAIVARQALTDMFFVGPVVVAMGAWALAFLLPDRALRTRPLRRPSFAARRGWVIAWDRAHVAFVVALVLTVACQLALLHYHVLRPETVLRVSKFVKRPGVPTTFTLYQIHLTMLIYEGLLVFALISSLRWRRRSQCWLGIMYLAGGVSMIGKGMIGPGLIGLLVLTHLLATGRLGYLRHSMLLRGALLFALVAAPWHHAMFLYRGDRWFNELIVINNLARFDTGEQEQAVGGFTFYLQTLGLAALPWIAALPAALWDNVARAYPPAATREAAPEGDEGEGEGEGASERGEETVRELRRLALLWFIVSLALITYSVTKYYHYLLPALPPMAALVGVWLADQISGHGRRGLSPRARWACAIAGVGLAIMVLRDVVYEPAWLAHLTTYLYTGMWRDGAPETSRLWWTTAPIGLGLALWAARRGAAAVVCATLAGVLTTAYVIDDYLPAASENWSQRTALRVYFDERGPEDPLMSWWFYYRGETFLSKANVWVLKERDRKQLLEFVAEHDGTGRALWVITTKAHAGRLRSSLPTHLRDGVETRYENFHYSLLRVPTPTRDAP
ncbi:MAG: hypothetical protein KC468_29910, partial [Myxococcales bacterium]|nr:hypothetical protein [Myxococcales bacterium]